MSGHKRGSPRDPMGIIFERKGQVHPYRWSLKVLGLPVCVASARATCCHPLCVGMPIRRRGGDRVTRMRSPQAAAAH